jgi:hypothetical protein
MPFLATSIIPLEKVTPANIPRLAMTMIMYRGDTLEPMEEFRKLTASLLTPTMRLKNASPASIINEKKYNSMGSPDKISPFSVDF